MPTLRLETEWERRRRMELAVRRFLPSDLSGQRRLRDGRAEGPAPALPSLRWSTAERRYRYRGHLVVRHAGEA